MGVQSERGGRSSSHGLLDNQQTSGNAKIQDLTPNPNLTPNPKLLDAQPSLRLHVVGHTDNVGTLPHNMTLSKQRADAVVSALVNDYKMAASRLIANGVGPLAPVASNAAEEGRAKNRRVELVAQ
jgi:OmpA-OmpF porin, OOP family